MKRKTHSNLRFFRGAVTLFVIDAALLIAYLIWR